MSYGTDPDLFNTDDKFSAGQIHRRARSRPEKLIPAPVGKQTGTVPTTGFNEENVTVPKQSRIRQYPSQHNKLA